MAEEYGFFNAQGSSGSYDRTYSAEDFSNYFAKFVPNGVFVGFSSELEVEVKSGMTVTVKSGWASIDGHYYHLTADKDIILSLNSGTGARTDSICCTLDVSQRKIEVIAREGASTPRNDGSYHDIILATISVYPNNSSILAENIVDRRNDKKYCGMINLLKDKESYTANRVIVSDGTGGAESSTVTVEDLEYIIGLQSKLSDITEYIDEQIAYMKHSFHTTINTQVTGTANWVAVEKTGFHLIQGENIRNDADYYVVGINKRTGARDNYTLIFNKSVDSAQMVIRLDWREKGY